NSGRIDWSALSRICSHLGWSSHRLWLCGIDALADDGIEIAARRRYREGFCRNCEPAIRTGARALHPLAHRHIALSPGGADAVGDSGLVNGPFLYVLAKRTGAGGGPGDCFFDYPSPGELNS